MEIHIERGRIRAVMPNTAGVVIRTETSSYEFPGATVLPGFVDSHCHVLGLGARLALPSLHNARSIDECINLLQNAESQESGWIQALGWNETQWDRNRPPHKSELDFHFPHTPVALSRIDGHTLWVNSEALRRAGVVHPSGVISEDERDPIFSCIPMPSASEVERRVARASSLCVSMGITEVHDMDVDPKLIGMYRELAESGRLPIRVDSFVSAQHNDWIEAGTLPAGGEFQRTVGIKMYADGALGSRTASLLQPYADAPSHHGLLLLNAQQITSRIRAAIDAGWWSVAVHAIGDQAAREVLLAFETVRSWDDGNEIILRMEHAQIVDETDIIRFVKNDIWALVQPLFALSDASMAEERLGMQRLARGYRWRSLLDSGVRISAGSDFPIESPDPLLGIDAFVRRIPSGHDSGWTTDETISQLEAVLAYTTWPREASDVIDRRGFIDVGYDADVVVLDADPRTCDPDQISSIKVLATFTAGIPRFFA